MAAIVAVRAVAAPARRPTWLFVLLALAGGAVFVAATLSATSSSPAPSAAALETELLAPCCFGGTLDGHDSDIARQLRAEIERRVRAGEPTAAIESDLVGRYGPEMRALPHPRALAWAMGGALYAAFLGALATVLVVRRWRDIPDAPRVRSDHDELDNRLDAELHVLD